MLQLSPDKVGLYRNRATKQLCLIGQVEIVTRTYDEEDNIFEDREVRTVCYTKNSVIYRYGNNLDHLDLLHTGLHLYQDARLALDRQEAIDNEGVPRTPKKQIEVRQTTKQSKPQKPKSNKHHHASSRPTDSMPHLADDSSLQQLMERFKRH